ncbi:MAG: P-loop NTPase fold protein [Pseudomonadota bacterium]
MWHDIEAKVDLLNFSLVAQAAAELIRESGGAPITIGVSGGWGVGKSSLVKMVGRTLEADKDAAKKYIFLEFNAWLYQGFDDARHALLQSVSDRLLEVAKERKTFVEDVVAFARRVKWLKLGRMALPTLVGLVGGGTLGGPVGAVLGAAGGFIRSTDAADREKELEKLKDAYGELHPELADTLKEEPPDSLPKEIQGLRDTFASILAKLDVTLVVLVDDLDRCLPNTAIATLEAMRLLLHVPRSAFIIAADEQMIRSAVRVHFSDGDISDDLVTSYFDKLIQVPLRVPRLGINEVKVYVMLLLAERAERRGQIPAQVFADAQKSLLESLKRAWSGGITHDVLKRAFGEAGAKALTTEIDMADQLAFLLVSAEQIAGNPRLIKRFLNNLVIREALAKAQGMTTGFDTLVKMQLFERCASSAAFEYLAKKVSAHDEGHLDALSDVEAGLRKGDEYKAPDPSWAGSFYEQWLRLDPPLAGTNLKPFLYLSRDRATSVAAYDQMSAEARSVLEAALQVDQVIPGLVSQLKALSEQEAEQILVRLVRRARSDNWSGGSTTRLFNCTDAHPNLGSLVVGALREISAKQRPSQVGPLLRGKSWAAELVSQWTEDKDTPEQLRRVLGLKGR